MMCEDIRSNGYASAKLKPNALAYGDFKDADFAFRFSTTVYEST